MFFLKALLFFILAIFSNFEGFMKNPATGALEFRIVTQTQEIEMGESEYGMLQDEMGGVYQRNPQLTAYVQKIGNKIAAYSDRPDLPYEFIIIDNPVPNACCLPGGKIIIHMGLLLTMRDEAELAAVLAHEIAHANLRHGAKMHEKELLGSLLLHPIANTLYSAGLRYTPENEFEADFYGLKYMQAAGYDPQGAIDSQNSMERSMMIPKERHVHSYLQTHPETSERKEALQKALSAYPKGGYRGREMYHSMMRNL